MNLGAMLHLVGKLKEAEEEYLSAWTLATSSNQHQRTANKVQYSEHLASKNTIKVNLKRLHNIMKSKGMPTKKATGIDD